MGNLQRLGAAFVACVVGAPLAWAQDEASISALVTAERQAELSAGRSGTLIELAVELGSEVAQGTVLARFDCAIEEARIAAAEVEVTAATQEVTVQAELQRRGAGGAALLARARVALRKAEAEQAIAVAEAQSCMLTAPFTGIVATLDAREYETIAPGTPILTLLDPGSVRLDLVLPASWVVNINKDSVLSFESDATGAAAAARITHIAPFIDATSQTIRARAAFETGNNLPRAGSAGVAYFPSQNNE